MKLSELMKEVSLKADFEGGLTHNDMVLAINTTPGTDTPVSDYAVLQIYIEGTEAELNPETSDKTFIRTGKSTNKTSTQRTFSVTGERYVGDAAQDFIFSHEIKFGTGAKVVTDYVYFDMITGKGEKGTVMIAVNTDGGGDASTGLEIDVDLMQNGAAPTEFDWSSGTAAAASETND